MFISKHDIRIVFPIEVILLVQEGFGFIYIQGLRQ